MPTTWAGGWITTWPRRMAALARTEAIYKDEKFSDHAPITIEYDVTL
jgi:exonuclease III